MASSKVDFSRRDISLPVKDWVIQVTTEHKIDLQSRIVRVLLADRSLWSRLCTLKASILSRDQRERFYLG